MGHSLAHVHARGHTIRLIAAFAAVYLVWGSTYLAMKVAIRTLPPILMGAIRFTVAGLLLLLILALLGKVRAAWLANPSYWRSAALTGGLMLLGANGVLAYGLKLVTTGTSALVVACTSVWIVLFDRLQVRRGATSWRVIAGLALGVAGVAALAGIFTGASSTSVTPPEGWPPGWPAQTIGVCVTLFSTVAWAAGSILGRRTPQPPKLLVGASMQMIAGGALMFVVSALLPFAVPAVGLPWPTFEWRDVALKEWGAIAYLAAFGSMIAFTAYVWLMQNASAARVSTYAYVNPIVAVILGWLFISEEPTKEVIVAAPLILAGVVLLQWAPRRARAATVVEVPPGGERAAPTASPLAATPRSTSPADGGR